MHSRSLLWWFGKLDSFTIRFRVICWQRVFISPRHYFVELAASVIGTKVWVDAPRLYPVVCDDANIAVAKQSLAQDFNAVINMCTDCWFTISKTSWSVFRTAIVLSISILSNKIL